jgi:hypothetical protein
MRNNQTARYVFSAVILIIAILSLFVLPSHSNMWGQTTTTALDPGVRVGGTAEPLLGNPYRPFLSQS